MSERKNRLTSIAMIGTLTVVSALTATSVATATPAAGGRTAFAQDLDRAAAATEYAEAPTHRVAHNTHDEAFQALDQRAIQRYAADPNFWVQNEAYDSSSDSSSSPELGNSLIAVTRAAPDQLILAALAAPSSSGSLTTTGYVGAVLDTNRDGEPDYGTVTPASYMDTDTGYSTPIFHFVGEDVIDTGRTATWLRASEGWAVSLPWKSMGIPGASYSMMLADGVGGYDFSPEQFSPYTQLAGVVGGTPPTVQRVAGAVPRVVKAKQGKRVALPRRTNGGLVLRWRSSTPAVCRVSGSLLVSTGRRGNCRLVATATGDRTRRALNQAYLVRFN